MYALPKCRIYKGWENRYQIRYKLFAILWISYSGLTLLFIKKPATQGYVEIREQGFLIFIPPSMNFWALWR
ncbi:Hypothetical protein CpCap5W_0180 [Corynebacterium pseudotuberculosis]|nr:Hypothetical protein Cp3995_0166 [Corynebacterium pseudotuberculosis 3/99-5]ALF56757.1 hypothetical protein AN902_00855 [Corynebacterium pseudotuberculosis]ALU16788.1 hypothetical protein AN397_00840 [Corynebacterium pseudotuberculosis]ALU18778.1 hypothetical protein AK970_00840 [Corynebacterium pseudotuberculosis]ALU20775.1 hypothetical protein AN398_00840 [Corynebacterium pseudotuberculosis]